ncbi:zinc finger protein aebp2-like [Limulus polyphemus]|uniref:Zinc finger protein aebp2-like n=1 Tax=Limulus polyphemus TaxID=6850 RepID=A0ABM1SNG7_LIMPO|nr:zinc finger protein aebp2-like [Limulus polyphemus]
MCINIICTLLFSINVTQENINCGTKSSTNFYESYPKSILSVSKVRENPEPCRSVDCEQEIFSVDTGSPNKIFLGGLGCPVLTLSVKTQTLYTGTLHEGLCASSSICKECKTSPSETKAQKDEIKSLKKKAVEERPENAPESGVSLSDLHIKPQRQTLTLGVNTAEVTLFTSDKLPDTAVASCSSTVSPGKKIKVCKWEDCDERLFPDQILEHIWNVHIEPQKEQKNYACLWKDCKVFNRHSSSQKWLNRHVLIHAGKRPFACIFPDCEKRFDSTEVMEKHINIHLRNDLSNKPVRRVIKIPRYRSIKNRQSDHASFFDNGIMERIKYGLMKFSEETNMNTKGQPFFLSFRSFVLGRRVDAKKDTTLLLHWVPENVFPDEWVSEDNVSNYSRRTVPLFQLPHGAIAELDPLIPKSVNRGRK